MASPTNIAYKGRLLLIKVSTGVSPTAYNTLMGVRSRTITINAEEVDITDSDNAPYRALLEDAGIRSVSITASGVYKDDQAMHDVVDASLTGRIESYLVQFPNGDTLEGEFQISTSELGGEFNAEQTYSITLASGGQWSFVRA